MFCAITPDILRLLSPYAIAFDYFRFFSFFFIRFFLPFFAAPCHFAAFRLLPWCRRDSFFCLFLSLIFAARLFRWCHFLIFCFFFAFDALSFVFLFFFFLSLSTLLMPRYRHFHDAIFMPFLFIAFTMLMLPFAFLLLWSLMFFSLPCFFCRHVCWCLRYATAFSFAHALMLFDVARFRRCPSFSPLRQSWYISLMRHTRRIPHDLLPLFAFADFAAYWASLRHYFSPDFRQMPRPPCFTLVAAVLCCLRRFDDATRAPLLYFHIIFHYLFSYHFAHFFSASLLLSLYFFRFTRFAFAIIISHYFLSFFFRHFDIWFAFFLLFCSRDFPVTSILTTLMIFYLSPMLSLFWCHWFSAATLALFIFSIIFDTFIIAYLFWFSRFLRWCFSFLLRCWCRFSPDASPPLAAAFSSCHVRRLLSTLIAFPAIRTISPRITRAIFTRYAIFRLIDFRRHAAWPLSLLSLLPLFFRYSCRHACLFDARSLFIVFFFFLSPVLMLFRLTLLPRWFFFAYHFRWFWWWYFAAFID